MRPVRAALGVLLAATLALAGCGGSSSGSGAAAKDNGVSQLAPKDIVLKSQSAAKAAKAVHVKGTIADGTQTVGIDMHLQEGSGGRGTVAIGDNQVEILRIGSDAYLKGDRQFWTAVSNAAVAEKLADKYVKGSTTDVTFKSFVEFTDLQSMFDSIFDTSSAGLQKVAGKPVGGVSTVGVKDPDPKTGGILYVATTGEPYPLLIESVSTSSDQGSVQFSEWNTPVTLAAPPADQVLDISTLG